MHSLVLGSQTFMDCVSLSSLNIGNFVVSLGTSCFENCIMIESLTLPDCCVEFGESVFENCSKLESFTFGTENQCKNISIRMFYNCVSLSQFTFPQQITKICAFSFVNTAITSVTLPQSVTLIERYAFDGCIELTEFIIPPNSQLQDFEPGIFSGCTSFKNITNFNSNFEMWNNALFNKGKTELIILPQACGIKYFAFPENVTTIRDGSIQVSSLEVVFIPYSVKYIYSSAFRNCYNLRSINSPSTVEYIGENAFEGCRMLNCGLSIENRTTEYIDNLISNAKMPKICLTECIRMCTNSNDECINFRLISYIFLVMHSK